MFQLNWSAVSKEMYKMHHYNMYYYTMSWMVITNIVVVGVLLNFYFYFCNPPLWHYNQSLYPEILSLGWSAK